MSGVSRRELMVGALAAAGGMALVAPSVAVGADEVATLGATAATHGLLFGSCSRGLLEHGRDGSPVLAADRDYRALFTRECRLMVSELELKMPALRPTPTRWDFRAADLLARLAADNGMAYRGHCLLWHESTPGWVASTVDASSAEAFVNEHVGRVCDRMRGRMHSWDVVNEAIDVQEGTADGLRKSLFLKLLGPRYMDIAFRAAHQADPQAMLCLNDYGIEYDHPYHEARRQALLGTVRRLLDARVPIHAIGIQAHLHAGLRPFSAAVLARFLADIRALGLKVIISELDVPDYRLPADAATRDTATARELRQFLDVALAEPAVVAVVCWGLSDRYSWLNSFAETTRRDGLPARGHPWDDQLRPKALHRELLAALQAAPGRS